MVEAVGLVASTGGPNALSRVLSELPADFPAPIFLVQHITPSFLDGFVGWLDGLTKLSVKIAHAGEIPHAGVVYLPPVDRHLEVRQGRLWHSRAAEVCNQRPSGTVLFDSMAKEYGPCAVGALLTGMGADGAEGLLAMRKAGAYTLAEDASTCVVYGMPLAAAQLGAASEVVPLPNVARRLIDLVGARRRETVA
jgi:two-component system chemotaxis response regulator CheB